MAQFLLSDYLVDPDAPSPCLFGDLVGASRDGQYFRCLRYSAPVDSDPGFEDFGPRKEKLYGLIRDIFGPSDVIVIPTLCAAHDGRWYEFTADPGDQIPDADYTAAIEALSEEARMAILEQTIDTLSHLHRHNIVHGCVNPAAVALFSHDDGSVTSRLCGLESAFPADAVPEHPPLDTFYSAPEQVLARSGPQAVTTAADIFSMGLLFHQFLTGELPQPPGAAAFVAPWQVLTTPLADGSFDQLVISDRITDPVLIALLSDMLHPDAACRPTPEKILQRLRRKQLPIQTTTWPGEGITIDADAVRQHVLGLRTRKLSRPGAAAVQGYEIITPDGQRMFRTAGQLVQSGLASVIEYLEEPWPEDDIRWRESKLKVMFPCVRRGSRPGLYAMTDCAGGTRQCTAAQLKMLRFAAGRKSAAPEPELPRWDDLLPEDIGCEISTEEVASMGLIYSCSTEMCGIRGYQFSDLYGNSRFISRDMCHALNLLRPLQQRRSRRNNRMK